MIEEPDHIAGQAVGAYGEKVVEAELLRHGWLPANLNKTVPNAAKFDVLAHRGQRLVAIRVRTCGAGVSEFVFTKFEPSESFSSHDFTVLVKMGVRREDDEIFVLPTRRLHTAIGQYRQEGLKGGLKDARWTLYLDEHKDDIYQTRRGFRKKWANYRDNWSQLDERSTPV